MSTSRPFFRYWFLRGFLYSCLLIVIMLLIQYRHILYCEMVSLGAFQEISKGVFVSEQIPKERYDQIRHLLKTGERRISDFWGEKKGKAKVIVCATPGEYEQFCDSPDGAGCSLGTFYGSSFIILNLYGVNADVISHEMCHNEVYERLGWSKVTFQVPQWFNEGLSMMMDYRFVREPDSLKRYERYLREWKLRTRPPFQRLRLEEIETLKGFFGGDRRHVSLAYLTAATEVSYWLMIVGREGLLEWAKRMKAENFDCYLEVEQACRKNKSLQPPANPIRSFSLHKPAE